MSATASIHGELELLRQTASVTRSVIHRNLEGITHEESMVSPPARRKLHKLGARTSAVRV